MIFWLGVYVIFGFWELELGDSFLVLILDISLFFYIEWGDIFFV